jgi:hypothetical protein
MLRFEKRSEEEVPRGLYQRTVMFWQLGRESGFTCRPKFTMVEIGFI